MLKTSNMPVNPGCYLYKNGLGKIIYIGKAKNLRKRVQSYFSHKIQDDKTKALVAEIRDIEFFITGNEVEALVLENNLIKKHRPRYNICLKDSMRYAYVLVTDEVFPRLVVARDRRDKGRYYGPFVSAEARDHALKILRESFLIRTCSKLPKRECLRYHIGICSAPCIGMIEEKDYSRSVQDAEHFLKGNVAGLVNRLRSEMAGFSSKMLYEKARIIRDQINALTRLSEKQRFEKDIKYDEDIVNYIISNGKVYLLVFNVVKGILASKRDFEFEYTDDFLDEFVLRYYSENSIPKAIILPHNLSDSSIIKYLSGLRGSGVQVLVPKKGDRLALLDIVRRNIEASYFADSQMVNELRKELNLNANPNVIECFDISNISGTNSVGSMVRFRNALPDKSNYRRFKIKTVSGTDDFASIGEIVYRRYARLKAEESEMPDLVVIDGGMGQLNAALDALNRCEVKIPIISLAKRYEEVYLPGKQLPIHLKQGSKALGLLVRVRNEAHRFAIKYHRLLRSKQMTE